MAKFISPGSPAQEWGEWVHSALSTYKIAQLFMLFAMLIDIHRYHNANVYKKFAYSV